ncbi:CPBP family intramembrane glutamic endopeptidase [Cyclobacterium plantarum]|uniref:CPBP family intramembrane metalloprotease n=1 Tax=Cyclobacterium plantarum TaxID=2716263 RepID=A0ABX0H7U3_9BACT|nr:CPBP family intramembrane glutamic endopeptidase [Cyclobacterium plantarum]NHE56546.1 CPBP family intramembrane metalloprotease [Cyclobacterium plantarum]
MNHLKETRHLVIFCILALLVGWVGLGVDRLIPDQNEEETLGMAIWLAGPLLVVIFLRTFAGDGWKDAGLYPNLKHNLRWYGMAMLIFPLVTIITLIIGKLTGWIDFSGFNVKAYFSIFTELFFINIIKNFFEESVWRGYLTAKLVKIRLTDFYIYGIAGLVWGLWHAPYYLHFLSDETIYAVLPVNRYLFMVIAVLNMVVWTVMFTEIFRLTRSIWSVILLHAMEDALINHLIIDGHIQIAAHKEIWLSPICGVLPMTLYLIIGLWLRKQRSKKTVFLN